MMTIENQIQLEDGISIIEIFNADDGTHYYYISTAYAPMKYMCDAPDYDRYEDEDLIDMYRKEFANE